MYISFSCTEENSLMGAYLDWNLTSNNTELEFNNLNNYGGKGLASFVVLGTLYYLYKQGLTDNLDKVLF